MNRTLLGMVLATISLAGCRRTPEATVSQCGVAIAYSTETTGFMHSTSTLGVVRVVTSGVRVAGLRGCPPYFAAARDDPFIVVCRSRGAYSGGPDLVFVNVVDGTSFSVDYDISDLGCGGGVSMTRDSAGNLVITMADSEASVTLVVDTAAGKQVKFNYVKHRRSSASSGSADGTASPADPAVPQEVK